MKYEDEGRRMSVAHCVWIHSASVVCYIVLFVVYVYCISGFLGESRLPDDVVIYVLTAASALVCGDIGIQSTVYHEKYEK